MINLVSEADRLKAVERMRGFMEPRFGDSPRYFMRKRSIYRALKRNDNLFLTTRYEKEIANIQKWDAFNRLFTDALEIKGGRFFRETSDSGISRCGYRWTVSKVTDGEDKPNIAPEDDS